MAKSAMARPGAQPSNATSLDLEKGEQQAAAPADDETQGSGGNGRTPEERTPETARSQPGYEKRRRDGEEPDDDDDVDIEPEEVSPVMMNRNDIRLSSPSLRTTFMSSVCRSR